MCAPYGIKWQNMETCSTSLYIVVGWKMKGLPSNLALFGPSEDMVFFPKQVYLWGDLTPLKGVHAWAVWVGVCLRVCLPAKDALDALNALVRMISHLSPTCLPVLLPWVQACPPLVSQLSPTCLVASTLDALSTCFGPNAFALVSHLSLLSPITLWILCPRDLRLVSLPPSLLWMLRVLWPAWLRACLPRLSPTTLWFVCPHDCTLFSNLSPSHYALHRHGARLAWFYTCFSHVYICLPLLPVSATVWIPWILCRMISGLSPTCLTLAYQYALDALSALVRMISHLSPTTFARMACHEIRLIYKQTVWGQRWYNTRFFQPTQEGCEAKDGKSTALKD